MTTPQDQCPGCVITIHQQGQVILDLRRRFSEAHREASELRPRAIAAEAERDRLARELEAERAEVQRLRRMVRGG